MSDAAREISATSNVEDRRTEFSGNAVMALGACAVGLVFSLAPLFVAPTSFFLKFIAADNSWGRSEASQILAVGLFVTAIAAPVMGGLIGRFGARPVIAISTLGFGLALASFAVLPSNFPLYLVAAALVGFFGAGTTPFAYLTIVAKWYSRNLGLSLGIAMTGIGIGVIIAPLVSERLLALVGWRDAYLVLGGTAIAVGLPNAIFLLREPASTSIERIRTSDTSAAPTGLTLREAVGTRTFWIMTAMFFLVTCVVAGSAIHVAPLLSDRGISLSDASVMISFLGFTLVVARLVTGIVLDNVDARVVAAICFLAAALGAAILALEWTNPWLMAGLLLLALAQGIEGDLLAFVVRESFGLRSFSAIYGALGTAFGVGTLVGPVVMGAVFDATGSYDHALWGFSVCAAISTLMLSGVRTETGASA